MLGVANHAVVKAGTHSQQHIAILHSVVGFNGAVHAQHAEEFLVAGWICTQTHQGAGNGVAQHVHQRTQLIRCVAQQHTAAGIDIGTLCRQQQLQCLANLTRMTLFDGVVRAHFHFFRIARVQRLLEGHVFRNIHHHRAGTASAGDVEGLLHGLSQIANVLDQEVVLDDGTRNAHGVAFLEGVGTNVVGRSLTGHHHHGDGVRIRCSNAGDRIGQAGAGCHQRHAHFTGCTCKAIGSVHSRLLMAHQHMLNAVLLVQRVVNIENCPAWVTPQVLDTFSLKRLDEDFGAH